MKYQLKDFNRNVSEEDLLDDLKVVAEKLGLDKITSRQYNSSGGKYTSGTMGVRFWSWNKALELAGLKTVMKHKLTYNISRYTQLKIVVAMRYLPAAPLRSRFGRARPVGRGMPGRERDTFVSTLYLIK